MEDLRALLCVLNVFGYFSGLRVNYAKTFAVVKRSGSKQILAEVAGVTVKPWVKYWEYCWEMCQTSRPMGQ